MKVTSIALGCLLAASAAFAQDTPIIHDGEFNFL